MGQIDFRIIGKLMYVYIQNNGVGPLILDRFTFSKNGKSYSSIKDCLELNPDSYMSIDVTDSEKKVILPGTYLEVFSTRFEEHEGEAEISLVRNQLSTIALKADCQDIYNNRIIIKRNFNWFARHTKSNK